MMYLTKELRDKFKVQNYVIGLFGVAGIKVKKIWQIPNQYDPGFEDYWYLINTELGIIEIGCRYRVISIQWEQTSIRKILTEDDTSKDNTFVHAWTELKCMEYLIELGKEYKKCPIII